MCIGKALNPTHNEFDVFDDGHIRNLNAILKLPELFKNAVYVDSFDPQKGKNQNPSFKGYHHFVAPIFMNNVEYRALITAREKVNSNTLYVLKVEVLPIKKRHTHSAAQQNAVGSQFFGVPLDVSIAEFVHDVKIYDYDLQKVNTCFDKDIIPCFRFYLWHFSNQDCRKRSIRLHFTYNVKAPVSLPSMANAKSVPLLTAAKYPVRSYSSA